MKPQNDTNTDDAERDSVKKLKQRVDAVEEQNEQLRKTFARFLSGGKSRRSILKLAGVGIAGIAIGGAGTTAAAGSEYDGPPLGGPDNRLGPIYADAIDVTALTVGGEGPITSLSELADYASGGGTQTPTPTPEPTQTPTPTPEPSGVDPATLFASVEKDETNPVFTTGSDGAWDAIDVRDPELLTADGTDYLYYSGRDANNTQRIGVAIRDADGGYSRPVDGPIVDTGDGWDSVYVRAAAVEYADGVFHMIYQGSDGQHVQLGHATSTDGIVFEKDPNPVLSVENGDGWDSQHLCHPAHLYENGTWHLWYSGNYNQDIGYATATDPTSFTRYGGNPVLTDTGDGWNHSSVTAPSVRRVGSTYHMVMSGRNGGTIQHNEQIGHYWSDDRVTWHANPENPIITVAADGWDDTDLAQPTFEYDADSEDLEVYYTGSNGSVQEIGRALLI